MKKGFDLRRGIEITTLTCQHPILNKGSARNHVPTQINELICVEEIPTHRKASDEDGN